MSVETAGTSDVPEGHEGVPEYTPADLDKVRAISLWLKDHDLKGRFICQAKLVNTIGVLPASRLEEGRDRRERGQVKRLQRRLDEVHARRADPITADDQARGIAELDATTPAALPAPAEPTLPRPAAGHEENTPDIDILDWRPEQ